MLDPTHASLSRPGTARRRRLPPCLVLLAIVLHASPAAAVRIEEFGVACADGSARISFIELTGVERELFDPRIGIRTLDRTGALLWEAPNVYVGISVARDWIQGGPTRRLGILTRETDTRLRDPAVFPTFELNLPMEVPLDTLAGTIELFRAGTGTPVTISRVLYGPGRAVATPPPGTSMVRSGTGWRIETNPHVDSFFGGAIPLLASPEALGCLGVPTFAIRGFMVRCDDGTTGGQYVELEARGDATYDERLRLRVYDHDGVMLGEQTDLFSDRTGFSCASGSRWLVGGPELEGPPGGGRDAALPASLDPVAGRIELSGLFRGVPWTQDVFSYGPSSQPSPPAGYAYDRPPGAAPTLGLPAPRNSFGVTTVPPECAFGSGRATPFVREFSLACMSGSTAGQFVELGILGDGLALDESYGMRVLDRNREPLFEYPGLFGARSGQTMARESAFLLAADATPGRAGADGHLPATLDTQAGTIELRRRVLGVERVLSALTYGLPSHPIPPNGTSLASEDGLTYRLEAYPTPTAFAGAAPIPDCEFADGVPGAEIRQLALRCQDGSPDGLFVELDSESGTRLNDVTLGLTLAGSSGADTVTVFPLFPAGEARMAAGSHRLFGAPGFAARTGLAPDHVLAPLATSPRSVRLFRRNPLTGQDRVLGEVFVPVASLSPGHGMARGPDGRYAEVLSLRPERVDGSVLEASDCYSRARPEHVRIRELLLRCRDGGTDAQYIELESTSAEAVTAPGLSLRAHDRAGTLLFQFPVPRVWPGDPPRWPTGIVVLAAGPGAQDRYALAVDAALPGVLDTLAGDVQLVLDLDGSERVVHEARYGIPGLPPPPAGASLVAADGGFDPHTRPVPENSRGESGRRECLGVCEERVLEVAGERRYAGVESATELSFAGASAAYDAPRAAFRLDAGTTHASVHLPDRYRIAGAPEFTPVRLELRLVTAARSSCTGCEARPVRVSLSSGTAADSASFASDTVTVLSFTRELRPSEDFDVVLDAQAVAEAPGSTAASLEGRLEFHGLPASARVVSCLGYDSERARPVADASAEATPDGVRLAWRVDPVVVERGTLQRWLEGDSWLDLETRTSDANAVLEFLDRRAERGTVLRYRLAWDDVFGRHASAPVEVTLPPRPGFALHGVHPNPSTGVFAARIEIPEAGLVRLEALDLAGRVVASQRQWLAAGAHHLPLARESALAPGVYVVRMHYRGRVSRTTAIVLR